MEIAYYCLSGNKTLLVHWYFRNLGGNSSFGIELASVGWIGSLVGF
jgi:hypothetical protein